MIDPNEGADADAWYSAGVAALRDRLTRYLAAVVPLTSDIDDLRQKTLLTAWEQRARFEPGRELFPWLAGIARNHVRHHLRSAARSRTVLDSDVAEQLADRLDREEPTLDRRHQALVDCLAKLPSQQRATLEGFYRDGRSVREFAAATGVGAEGLYKSLQRLRAALLECVTRTLAQEER